MRPAKRILVFIVLVISFSCEDAERYLVNCSECFTSKPANAVLEIKCTDTDFGTTIRIYEGTLEDNLLYSSFMTYSSKVTHTVPLNKKFTLTATYSQQDKEYITVNTVMPRFTLVKDQCEEQCYYVYDKVVDLKLKYTK